MFRSPIFPGRGAAHDDVLFSTAFTVSSLDDGILEGVGIVSANCDAKVLENEQYWAAF